ncbi:hypothetical protein V2J09_008284 [Rumex salicifolius]
MASTAYFSSDCSVPAGSAANCAFRGGVPTKSGKEGERKIHWVFLGCPGVGKGTYASRLSNHLGVPHIATGDLVRHELASSGPLASKRLEVGQSKGESGFILDGFPRTVRQAEILEGIVDIELVINLKLREEALIAKCLGRRICSECGGNFNVASIDLKNDKKGPALHMDPLLPPPECESKLITRIDDEEEIVKRRLQIYHETTEPVEEFYRRRGKLLQFELPGGIPESWTKLLQMLNLNDHNHQTSAAA